MRAALSEMPITFTTEDGGFVRRKLVWGDMEASHVTVRAGTDLAPAFVGLAHDTCPARHWGYVLTGRMRVRYVDREEVCAAGDLYYWPPYHMPVFEQDTELVEFSPVRDQTDLRQAQAARGEAPATSR